MGWKEFEDWVGTRFASVGYQPNVTPRSHDGGADLILRPPADRSGRPVICQCKHRGLGQGSVDEKAIEDVLRARRAYARAYDWMKQPALVAVTNGRFTLGATSAATENGVVLVDGCSIDGLSGVAASFLSERTA